MNKGITNDVLVDRPLVEKNKVQATATFESNGLDVLPQNVSTPRTTVGEMKIKTDTDKEAQTIASGRNKHREKGNYSP